MHKIRLGVSFRIRRDPRVGLPSLQINIEQHVIKCPQQILLVPITQQAEKDDRFLIFNIE
jgi:hypothetical protein